MPNWVGNRGRVMKASQSIAQTVQTAQTGQTAQTDQTGQTGQTGQTEIEGYTSAQHLRLRCSGFVAVVAAHIRVVGTTILVAGSRRWHSRLHAPCALARLERCLVDSYTSTMASGERMYTCG